MCQINKQTNKNTDNIDILKSTNSFMSIKINKLKVLSPQHRTKTGDKIHFKINMNKERFNPI
jgi:hypothetical protein